jgi:hypothetical protein
LSDSLKSIGGTAFYNCKKITSISLPDSLISIGDYAFYNCTNLTKIILPVNITELLACTFKNCTSLSVIYIPSSVTTISGNSYDKSPFVGCLESLSIFCETNDLQDNWGKYWNYYASGKQLTVTYGATREDVETLNN